MRILYVDYTMNMGGIENFLMNITRRLHKDNKIDFLCYSKKDFIFDDELKQMNCNVYKISDPASVSPLKHFKEVKQIIKNGKYDVVHCNTYIDSGYVMLAAYLCNVKVRITHSHTSQKSISFKQRLKWAIGKVLIKIFANNKIACGELAGKSLFGKSKFLIIENGIDLNKYSFNNDIRTKIRKNYNIKNDEIVIGHVGRFAEVKNHKFIIEVARHLKEKKIKFKALLLGSGPEKDNIIQMTKDYDLTQEIIFTGDVFDSYNYYNAMDVILFPSLYEGLPLVFVEAQINGLNIVASNTISKESNLIGNVCFLDLNDNIDIWASYIVDKSKSRNENLDYFSHSFYNLDNVVSKLLSIYNKKNSRG